MKWIGQQIYDFVSRFRNDVYLEDISTGTIASGGNLGLDSNNKIVKENVPSSVTINGSTANGIATYGGASQIDIESNVTISGTTLANLGGTLSVVAGGELILYGSPKVSVISGRLDISGASTTAGYINLYEDTDNGTNAVKLIGPTSCSDRTITLPDATGTVALTNTHHHFLNAGFFLNYPFSRYIPLNGSISEQNTSTLSPEYTHFIFPYDGYVKTMWLRSETDMGSTELKLYGGTAGNEVTTAKGAVTATVDATQTIEFDFTSVTNTFVQGESMAVRIDPTDDPDGGQNITIELVFDLTT